MTRASRRVLRRDTGQGRAGGDKMIRSAEPVPGPQSQAPELLVLVDFWRPPVGVLRLNTTAKRRKVHRGPSILCHRAPSAIVGDGPRRALHPTFDALNNSSVPRRALNSDASFVAVAHVAPPNREPSSSQIKFSDLLLFPVTTAIAPTPATTTTPPNRDSRNPILSPASLAESSNQPSPPSPPLFFLDPQSHREVQVSKGPSLLPFFV